MSIKRNLKELFEIIEESEKYVSGDALFDDLQERGVIAEEEVDFELEVEEAKFEEVNLEEKGDEEDEEIRVKDVVLINLAKRYIRIMKSEIKAYRETEGARIIEEIRGIYGKGVAEFIREAGKANNGRGLIRYLEQEF